MLKVACLLGRVRVRFRVREGMLKVACLLARGPNDHALHVCVKWDKMVCSVLCEGSIHPP